MPHPRKKDPLEYLSKKEILGRCQDLGLLDGGNKKKMTVDQLQDLLRKGTSLPIVD